MPMDSISKFPSSVRSRKTIEEWQKPNSVIQFLRQGNVRAAVRGSNCQYAIRNAPSMENPSLITARRKGAVRTVFSNGFVAGIFPSSDEPEFFCIQGRLWRMPARHTAHQTGGHQQHDSQFQTPAGLHVLLARSERVRGMVRMGRFCLPMSTNQISSSSTVLMSKKAIDAE
ncbi:hypothetical protein SAMN05421753_112193 [Planctomicrobium piriforme]|uniref:Uncharacterized protein n=1 Tax=Planctomicrobium piriforme TaxID=1576369 RepID=A0A1I3LA86_9PLAN|nr:hypothetical protein SAMN05421753_112193 [Planctomicrobium piriforme]